MFALRMRHCGMLSRYLLFCPFYPVSISICVFFGVFRALNAIIGNIFQFFFYRFLGFFSEIYALSINGMVKNKAIGFSAFEELLVNGTHQFTNSINNFSENIQDTEGWKESKLTIIN